MRKMYTGLDWGETDLCLNPLFFVAGILDDGSRKGPSHCANVHGRGKPMADTQGSAKRTVPIQVSVTLQSSSSGETAPQSVAYAFTSNGRFLTKAVIPTEGKSVLHVPAVASAREVRIVAGPELSGEDAPALSDLTRRGATEQFIRIQPDSEVSPVSFEIPSEIWRCWIRFCRVQGTVLKSVITGGLPVDLPVCGATVQIWEVEPIEFILPRLPISIIEKLRQIVINPALVEKVPTPVNPPDPAPFVGVGGLSTQLQLARPEPTVNATPTASPEFASLQILAQTSSGEAFRASLIPYIPIIRPWLCELIPLFVTKTLVATTTTDRCGNFEDVIFLSCLSPSPNLYFTASVSFFGGSISIYDPAPVVCYTHWGYTCGSSVTLFTNSIFAPCCLPCAPINAGEHYVLFRAIGGVALSSIYGASPLLPSSPLGLAAGAVVAGEDSPFGGLLLPRVEFDDSLLQDGLAAFYQISYQDASAATGWVPLTGDISRHYNEFVGTTLITKSYPLGPQTVGTTPNLFAIPPALPPVGDWAYPSPAYDLANAQFPTTSLPTTVETGTNGMYQLKLDLYDSSGNPVDITATGIKYYVPSTVESDGTVDTVDASTLGLVVGNSFIFSVYVDNEPTQAALPEVSTSVNSTVIDPCGILLYNTAGDNADIEYLAYQPNNFLDWTLDVVRGTSGSVAYTAGNTSAGAPLPGTPADFINSTTSLTRALPPATTGCTQAAFAVNLYCASRATDGWNRLSGNDRSASIAFALTVPCPKTGDSES